MTQSVAASCRFRRGFCGILAAQEIRDLPQLSRSDGGATRCIIRRHDRACGILHVWLSGGMRQPTPLRAATAAITLALSLSACAAMLDRLEGGGTVVADTTTACPGLLEVTPTWASSTSLPPFEIPAVPPSLQPRFELWKRVWGRLSPRQHLLVDSDRPWLIWAETDCRGLDNDVCADRQQAARAQAVARFDAFANGTTDDDLLAAFDGDSDRAGSAEDRLITLHGRRYELRRAIELASGELHDVEGIFADAGVPRAFARLALFESGWRNDRVSHKGAAGIFQFTTSTGQSLLRVDEDIDERLDARRSAFAAAAYLKELRDQLGSWPLAVTAYNTGPTRLTGVMKSRASRDLGVVANGGDLDGFGFDGQNYFAQISAIAAITADEPLLATARSGQALQLKRATPLAAVATCVDVDVAALVVANPAITAAVVEGERPVPADHIVWIPGRDDGSRFATR